VHKIESHMSIKDIQKRVSQLRRAKSKNKRHAKAIKSLTKQDSLSSGVGVAYGVGALLPKPSPQMLAIILVPGSRAPRPAGCAGSAKRSTGESLFQ
jgi:hypothetical protein